MAQSTKAITPQHEYFPGAKLNSIERVAGMRWLRKSGCTLEQVAERYGLTRERVRQILLKAEHQDMRQAFELLRMARSMPVATATLENIDNGT